MFLHGLVFIWIIYSACTPQKHWALTGHLRMPSHTRSHSHTFTQASPRAYVYMHEHVQLKQTAREKRREQPVPINSTYRCESKRDRIYQYGDLKWGSLDGVEGQRRYHTKVGTLPMQHLEGDPRRGMVKSFSLTYRNFCIPNILRAHRLY